MEMKDDVLDIFSGVEVIVFQCHVSALLFSANDFPDVNIQPCRCCVELRTILKESLRINKEIVYALCT
jgi:hypothetical protein